MKKVFDGGTVAHHDDGRRDRRDDREVAREGARREEQLPLPPTPTFTPDQSHNRSIRDTPPDRPPDRKTADRAVASRNGGGTPVASGTGPLRAVGLSGGANNLNSSVPHSAMGGGGTRVVRLPALAARPRVLFFDYAAGFATESEGADGVPDSFDLLPVVMAVMAPQASSQHPPSAFHKPFSGVGSGILSPVRRNRRDDDLKPLDAIVAVNGETGVAAYTCRSLPCHLGPCHLGPSHRSVPPMRLPFSDALQQT